MPLYQASTGGAPAEHTHAETDVTSLTTDLDGKAPTVHGHTALGAEMVRLATANTDTASGSRTMVGYDTTTYADTGFTTNTSTGTITVTDAGFYDLYAHAHLSALYTGGMVRLSITNGSDTEILRGDEFQSATGGVLDLAVSGSVKLAAGASVKGSMFTSGSTSLQGDAGGVYYVLRAVQKAPVQAAAGGGGAGSSYLAGAFVFSIPGTQTTTSVSPRRYNNTGRTLTITKVEASVSTPPAGAALILDVKKNGTSIFANTGQRTTIAAAANTGSSVPTGITTWAPGEYLEVFVTQAGSTTAGENLTGEVVCQG